MAAANKRRVFRELLAQGRFDGLGDAASGQELNALFSALFQGRAGTEVPAPQR